MTAPSLNQFLQLYTWFPVAALVGFLLLIARFYARFSGFRTYHRLFLLPVICFAMAAVRYAGLDRITGDVLADVLLGFGGMVLIALLTRLYWLMLIRRRGEAP
ncbi:MAG: hypothetical protein SF029_03070 [bacterium]|nr:hypothetical protein [bacterium]